MLFFIFVILFANYTRSKSELGQGYKSTFDPRSFISGVRQPPRADLAHICWQICIQFWSFWTNFLIMTILSRIDPAEYCCNGIAALNIFFAAFFGKKGQQATEWPIATNRGLSSLAVSLCPARNPVDQRPKSLSALKKLKLRPKIHPIIGDLANRLTSLNRFILNGHEQIVKQNIRSNLTEREPDKLSDIDRFQKIVLDDFLRPDKMSEFCYQHLIWTYLSRSIRNKTTQLDWKRNIKTRQH